MTSITGIFVCMLVNILIYDKCNGQICEHVGYYIAQVFL